MVAERPAYRRRKRQDFFIVYNRVIDRFGEHLGAAGVGVYAALCRYAGADAEAWPSISTLSKRLSLHRPGVRRYIERLERLGLVTVEEHQGAAGDHYSHTYWIEEVPEEPPAGWQDGPAPARASTDLGRKATEGVGRKATEGRSKSDRGVGRKATPKKIQGKKTQQEEERFNDVAIRNLAINYVGQRCFGHAESELPFLPGFDWAAWQQVRDTKTARQTVRAEKLMRGATW